MDELPEIPLKNLRKGYTTGTCATACVKGALIGLINQEKVEKVTVELPIGKCVCFTLINHFYSDTVASCSTIKDAGDDPDVTDGVLITATIRLNNLGKIVFEKGKGVGEVTLEGLPIAVGEPAINPVPRKMMQAICRKILSDNGILNKGVNISISVAGGERLAKKTLNPRLGILGGISILGTTGIVMPFSSASYVASIVRGVDVAVANHCTHLLISAGQRSENFLRAHLKKMPDIACIHYGNWIRETLEKIVCTPEISDVSMGIMLGKAVKLVKGQLNTHSGSGGWDVYFIYKMALLAGIEKSEATKILSLKMAGQLVRIFPFVETHPFYQKMIIQCKAVCRKILGNHVKFRLYLVGRDGKIIGF